VANPKKIRQRITIEEVDNGEFKISASGRDSSKNAERVGKTADEAKATAKELVDLTFEKSVEPEK
jgi:hypothetical protein